MDPYAALGAAMPARRDGYDYNSVMPTFRRFVANGYSPMDAAAITGNFAHEADIGGRFQPGAKEYGGGGHGMGQWTASRWNGPDGLKQYANSINSDWRDPQTQMDFFNYDASHNVQAGRALDKMRANPTLEGKTNDFMMGWERPRHSVDGNPNTYAGHMQRLEHAQNIMANADNYGPPMPQMQTADAAQQAPAANAYAPPANPQNAVAIDPNSALAAVMQMPQIHHARY